MNEGASPLFLGGLEVAFVEKGFGHLGAAELGPGRLKLVSEVADRRGHGGVRAHPLRPRHVLLQRLCKKTVPRRLWVEDGFLLPPNVVP